MEDDEERQFNEWEAQARADAREAGLTVGHWSDVDGYALHCAPDVLPER